MPQGASGRVSTLANARAAPEGGPKFILDPPQEMVSYRRVQLFCYRSPPSAVQPCRWESVVLRPALYVLSWKIRALVARRRRALFVPPRESGHVVLLPIEQVPSLRTLIDGPGLSYPSAGTGKRFMTVKLRARRATHRTRWLSPSNGRRSFIRPPDIETSRMPTSKRGAHAFPVVQFRIAAWSAAAIHGSARPT